MRQFPVFLRPLSVLNSRDIPPLQKLLGDWYELGLWDRLGGRMENWFLEWILQNKAGHLMMFAQRSILNLDGSDLDKNKAEN